MLTILLQELVEDVAVATSSRHADLSWGGRFADYTTTKLKAWFRRLLGHPARKRSGPIQHPGPTWGKPTLDKI